MSVYGGGFLLLVPLVLGIIHAYRIADGFREEVRDGPRWPIAMMGLAAMLILPALGLWMALHDRAEHRNTGAAQFLPFLTPLVHEIAFHK